MDQSGQSALSLQTLKVHAALAKAGFCSRRKAEVLITEGKVRINGEVAHLGQRIDPNVDKVSVEGRSVKLFAPERFVILVDKPVGIISTTKDELGRDTIIDYLIKNVQKTEPQLAEKLKHHRLYPVGRLDLESEGLLMVTNDGDLTQKYTHPSFESMKTYRVTVEGQPTEKALSHLERGVKLHEGYTAPATVEVIQTNPDQSVIDISIHEGKYQQVRRMFLRVGYPVIKLVRTHMGEYTLADLNGKVYKVV